MPRAGTRRLSLRSRRRSSRMPVSPSCAATSPRRRGDQTLRRLARTDEPYRPRRGLRDGRGPAPRDRRRQPGHRRQLRHGPEILRAEGLPGMAEVGTCRCRTKLLKQGVRDMIRFRTPACPAPAWYRGAACGAGGGRRRAAGAGAHGDLITLDVRRGRCICMSRTRSWRRAAPLGSAGAAATRGYSKMYVDHVLQADQGVDLDFLVGKTGSPVPRDNH